MVFMSFRPPLFLKHFLETLSYQWVIGNPCLDKAESLGRLTLCPRDPLLGRNQLLRKTPSAKRIDNWRIRVAANQKLLVLQKNQTKKKVKSLEPALPSTEQNTKKNRR